MVENEQASGWVWVVVYDQKDGSHYLGLYSEEQNINFIPAFESKEAAADCFLTLPREKGKKYEIQAIHIEELTEDARNNGFSVALVDAEGKVIR